MVKKWKTAIVSPFIIITIVLLLKTYFTRIIVFSDANIGKFFVLDLPAILILILLVELLCKKKKFAVLMIINSILTGIFFAIIMYHKYFGIVVTYSALQLASQVVEVEPSVLNLTDPYFLFIFVDIFIFLVLLLNKNIRRWSRTHVRLDRKVVVGLLMLSLLTCYANIVMNRPILNEKKQAAYMGLLEYEVYVPFKNWNQEKIDPKSVNVDSIKKVKGITEPTSNKFWGLAKGRNVIVIQLESFQNFLLKLSVEGNEVTPVLNSLLSESLYFPHIFTQIGQGNTSDAEFMLNTSFYPPAHGAASEVYGDKDLPSFPKIVKALGYKSYTFHTNSVIFWNRKNLYPALGFDRYYDDNFFGNKDFIAFGASDEVLYNKTVDELAKIAINGQKFYANLIAMSAHHPFDLPDPKRRLTLPKRFDNTLVGNYLISQNYADYALGIFIDKMKEDNLWDKSLIVIYGDHFGLPENILDQEDKKLMQELIGKPYNIDTMYNIPLIIHIPSVTSSGQVINQVGGQVDFMPTMANLLGISLGNHIHFGQDLLYNQSNLLGERYYLPYGSFLNDEIAFLPGIGIKDGTTVSLGTTQTLSNQKSIESDFDRINQLEKMSDSYVENLPERKN